MPTDPSKTRYYRKQIPLFRLLEKMKLWPSRTGVLHGIKELDVRGSYAHITTHCNKHMVVHDSKNSRAARWLRNKWFVTACRSAASPIGSWRSTTPRTSSGSTARICARRRNATPDAAGGLRRQAARPNR